MAFIGESRESNKSPWDLYVCLDWEECEMIMDAVGKSVGRRLKSYCYYKDLVESGEATSKQQDKYIEAEENYETILSVHDTICKYLNMCKKNIDKT